MSREQNIAYLATFQKMYLTKDVFLIPYYLARAQHVPLKIIYGSNQGDAELPKCYRNAVLVGHSRRKVSKTNEMFDWIYIGSTIVVAIVYCIYLSRLHSPIAEGEAAARTDA